MIKEDKAELCSVTLVLLIHGIVLFPNIDNFVDHLAVKIFLTNNPVSFLLADFYHTFHTRCEKRGGTYLYCNPLLDLWMRTHIPQRGPFANSNISWLQRLTYLSSSWILWYKREWETKDVILRCGGFPNVPLIGIRVASTIIQCYSRDDWGILCWVLSRTNTLHLLSSTLWAHSIQPWREYGQA